MVFKTDSVQSALDDAIPDAHVLWVKSSQSTNSDIMKMAENNVPAWTVLVADSQSQGRGRHQRPWVNTKGGLFFSVLLRLEPAESPITLIPLVVGLSLQEAILSEAKRLNGSVKTGLKWPNDLICENGKVAGILCETAYEKKRWIVVAGVGINFFDVENNDKTKLSGKASSLHGECDVNWTREELLTEFLQILKVRIDNWYNNPSVIREEWKKHFLLLNKKILVKTGKENIEGIARGISDIGALILETDKGFREINAAEGIENFNEEE